MANRNNNDSSGGCMGFFVQLLSIFCGNNNNQQQQQGGFQQGQQQQGQGQFGYPGQQQPQYPGQQQQQPWQQGGQQQHGQQQHGQGAWGNQAPHQQQQHQQNNQYPPKPHGGQNQDMENASNSQYQQWRNEARREGDQAHKCFADSQTAYKRGDGGRAHDLSVQGKQHQAKQDELDDRASAWIFQENNKTQPRGTIDLHGLFVKEAIEQVDKAIANCQQSGMDELRVITGKGIHSQNHQAKIKPAVADLMRKYNLSAEVDPHNAGVLVVDLQGRGGGNRSRDAGGIVDQMSKNDNDCVIM